MIHTSQLSEAIGKIFGNLVLFFINPDWNSGTDHTVDLK